MNRKELEAKIEEYLNTMDDSRLNQWCATPHDLSADVFQDFVTWLYHEDDAKEARRKQYLALKAEFETNGFAELKPGWADAFSPIKEGP